MHCAIESALKRKSVQKNDTMEAKWIVFSDKPLFFRKGV
jgi:hypothetical protein